MPHAWSQSPCSTGPNMAVCSGTFHWLYKNHHLQIGSLSTSYCQLMKYNHNEYGLYLRSDVCEVNISSDVGSTRKILNSTLFINRLGWWKRASLQVLTGCEICKVPRSFAYSGIFMGSLKKCYQAVSAWSFRIINHHPLEFINHNFI